MADEDPNYEAIEQAEAVAVRAALDRGFLTTDQLREALLLREQLRVSGRQMRLLALLGSRFIKPEHQAELSQVYFEHLSKQPPPPPPSSDEEPTVVMTEEMLFSSDDELAVPEFTPRKTTGGQARPAAEGSAPVDELMAGGADPEPAEPSSAPAPEEEKEQFSESGLWRWLKRHLPGGGGEL